MIFQDNDFKIESDGECPPSEGRVYYESKSSSDASDDEVNCKCNPKDNDFDSESDDECSPLEEIIHFEYESSSYDSDNEDNYCFTNIKNSCAQ